MKLAIFLLVTVVGLTSNVTLALSSTNLGETETLSIDSSYLHEQLSLSITLPASYKKNSDKHYPIIFDLHPQTRMYLAGVHDWLSHNAERPWLETIIVTPSTNIVASNLDSTGFANLLESTIKKPKDKKFLKLLDEMLSAVDKNYRTNKFRIYSGFMRNGAVGLYALINKPSLFNSYLIASPALGNDFMNIVSESESVLPTLKDKIRTLYVSAGNHRFEQGNVNSLKQFISNLNKHAPKELEWQANLEDNTHYMSRPINNLVAGIEVTFEEVFTNLQPDSDIAKKGADAIINYYKGLSNNKYGFEISAESSLLALAQSVSETSSEKAMSILVKTVKKYPNSPFALNSLAVAYAGDQNFEKAKHYQRLALENSSHLFPKQQEYLRTKLSEYEKQSD